MQNGRSKKVDIVSVDDLAPTGARSSADTMLMIIIEYW